MTDSQFLYSLMLHVNKARALYPKAPLSALLKNVADLQKNLEEGADRDKLHDECLGIACIALRLSVEVWKDGE